MQWRTEGFWRPGRRWELAPPSACQTDTRWRCSPSLFGGLGRSPSRQRFWEHLGVNGTHFWIALIPLSTRRVRLASAKGALPRYWRVSGGAPAANVLGAFGCEWNPFLNTVNTFANSACQNGKLRRTLSLSCYLGSAFGCKWNPFLNCVNTIFNSFGTHCGPAACGFIVIMPFGNSRRGATVNYTGACRLTHIRHEPQNVRFYVLLLHRGAKI